MCVSLASMRECVASAAATAAAAVVAVAVFLCVGVSFCVQVCLITLSRHLSSIKETIFP